MSSRIRNYSELIDFRENCKKVTPVQVNIIDDIFLENREMLSFLRDFKCDQKWLIPYIGEMHRISYGKWQCIMVSSSKSEFPIIVYANMCLYPQYVGFMR